MKKISLLIGAFLCLALVSFISKTQTGIKIGKQEWMPTNLTLTSFLNGEKIYQARSAKDWEDAANNGTPAFCYYQFDSLNAYKYGVYYNWHTVNDKRGLAPKGWRVANKEDWDAMMKYFGGPKMVSNKIIGTKSSSNFNAQLFGYCNATGSFQDMNKVCKFWTSEEDKSQTKNGWSINFAQGAEAKYQSDLKGLGYQIRCIKK